MDTPNQGNGPGPSPLQMADQAMNQGMSQRDNQTPATSQSQDNKIAEILNLEGVSKFKFGDREWTPDDLRKSILMHQDYTKKTQETAKERKYFDNLAYDLRAVADNPALKDEFMKTYPEKFHSYLEVIQDRLEAQQEQAHGQDSPGQDLRSQLPKELIQRLDRVENYVKEKEIAAYDAQLDAKFSTLQSKFPDADQEVIIAQAEAFISNGGKPDDKVWEQLFKNSHDKFNQRIEAKQKATLNNQRSANQKAKDMGPGGGTPTSAPTRSGGLKGAEEAAIRHYGRS